MSWVGGPYWEKVVLGIEKQGSLKHLIGKKSATEITVASNVAEHILHLCFGKFQLTQNTVAETRTMD